MRGAKRRGNLESTEIATARSRGPRDDFFSTLLTSNFRAYQMVSWLEIAVEVAAVDAELVAEVWRPHCPGGVAIEEQVKPLPSGEGYLVNGDAAAVVKAYLPDDEQGRRLRRSLRLALGFVPLQSPPRWRRARNLREEDWQDAWKRYFDVQRIGKRITVRPSWAQHEPSLGEIVIEIDPGLTFGTGQHPTTALCLRALEELVRPGPRALDVGTGSGILAIAAAKLGAREVLALDIEPLAVKAARQNVRANGVEAVVRVEEGTLDEARAAAGRFDIIVANLSGLTIETMAPALARALAADGWLVVSGFLEDAVEGLKAALESHGLATQRVMAEGEWRALVARKGPAGA